MSDKMGIKYIWVDEDGEQVSPTHGRLGSALNFINGWHDRYDRLKIRNGGDVDLTEQHSAMGYTALSKTGKPPVKLERLVIRATREPISEHEQAVVDTMMGSTS